MCHLWLLDFLNVIELTAVNGNSENFQDLDKKQSLWLAMFTKDHQKVVFVYALDHLYYKKNWTNLYVFGILVFEVASISSPFVITMW